MKKKPIKRVKYKPEKPQMRRTECEYELWCFMSEKLVAESYGGQRLARAVLDFLEKYKVIDPKNWAEELDDE